MSVYITMCMVALAFGYLVGSVPWGLVLTRAGGAGNLREIGSGNIGATNVLRTGHKGLAAATLLADLVKGAIAVVIAARWGIEPALAAGFGAFLGHIFPVWLKFKGGKGVATYLGVLLALAWPVALVFAGIWLLAAFAARYSSLAALIAAAATPSALALAGNFHVAALFLVMSVIIFITHRGNIARLMQGTEAKISFAGKS